MSSLPQQKPKMPDEKENNTNKFVPMKKIKITNEVNLKFK